MATFRLPPGQMRRRPERSMIDRATERAHGWMVHRTTLYDRVQWLDNLGVGNGMQTSTECAEMFRRYGRAARAQIAPNAVIAWNATILLGQGDRCGVV